MIQMAKIRRFHRPTHPREMRRNTMQKAPLLAQAFVEMFRTFKDKVLIISADNGKEFTRHQGIAKELDALFYFAHPYYSWERGLNENKDGLIRQYFPKKTNLTNADNEKIIHVQNALNPRPKNSRFSQASSIIQ